MAVGSAISAELPQGSATPEDGTVVMPAVTVPLPTGETVAATVPVQAAAGQSLKVVAGLRSPEMPPAFTLARTSTSCAWPDPRPVIVCVWLVVGVTAVQTSGVGHEPLASLWRISWEATVGSLGLSHVMVSRESERSPVSPVGAQGRTSLEVAAGVELAILNKNASEQNTG